MSNEKESIIEYRARDGIQIKLTPQIIRKYLVSGRSEMVTDQELFIYMGLCKSRGLNPFIRDCYITKFSQSDPAAIITSIDYYRKRARAQKDCKGWQVGIIVQGEKGTLEYRKGCILLENETLIGGWAEAVPEGWTVPMRKEVNLKRYIKRKQDGTVTRFWSPDNQPEQIAKVAESQLLRSAWPDEFQGLYVDAEIQSRDAQEDFNAAVSTATPVDSDTPSFEEEFAAEISDPMWRQFITAYCDNYKMSESDARARFLEGASDVKAAFAKWKQQAPPASPPAGEKSFRDEWINLKGPGFSTFVWKNVERFKAAPENVRQEAVDKWQKLYPGVKCPFADALDAPAPPENGKEGAGQAQGPAAEQGGSPWQGEPVSPETNEFVARGKELDELWKSQGFKIIEAQKSLGFAQGHTWPPSLDGRVLLIEETRRLMGGDAAGK